MQIFHTARHHGRQSARNDGSSYTCRMKEGYAHAVSGVKSFEAVTVRTVEKGTVREDTVHIKSDDLYAIRSVHQTTP